MTTMKNDSDNQLQSQRSVFIINNVTLFVYYFSSLIL